MKRSMVLTILAGLCLGIAGARGASAQAPIEGSAADEETIRNIVLGRIDSFNRHEPPAPGHFTADADFVNVYGLWRKGPAEIQGRQGDRMRGPLKDAQVTLRDLRIRFIRPDVAVVHELHEMKGMLSASGEKMPPHDELSIRVMVKEQGQWLTTAFHNTIVRPDGLPAPAKK
jgi:uncharacterized protein (TIGR02246 family)